MLRLALLLLLILPYSTFAITDTSLVSCWPLDETSGIRYDSVDVSNDLSDNNTVLYAGGKISNAAQFVRADSEYLSITDGSQSGLDITGDMSLSFWLYIDSLPSASSAYGLISKWSGAPNNQFLLQLRNDGGTYYLRFYNSDDGTNIVYDSSSYSFTTGTWYHIVLVYDASAGSAEIYINGSSHDTLTTLDTSIINASGVFYLGAFDASSFFDGRLDEVFVYSRALSSGDVVDLYNSNNALGCSSVLNPDTGTTSTTTTSTTTTSLNDGNIVFMLAMILFILFFWWVGYIINIIKDD